jgi:alkylation response protein AidB-like acyl-CoA dehydrogenase
MDWVDTPDQAAFRREVRDVIDRNLPHRYRHLAETGSGEGRQWEFDRKSDDPAARDAAASWHGTLTARGWVAAAWPAEYGGGGLSAMQQFILNQELARVGAPHVGGSGIGLLGPTLIMHGTQTQKDKYLPQILSGESVWAQGYSEPGAGSDLAALQTRAVRDGDDFILNGQKIWTSGAHTADAIFALVRTDPMAPKHRGISFLLIDDIRAPGITVQPLIDMTGHHYFNEVFFEDVRVPVRNLVGDLNRGWYVGMTLLDFERSGIGGAVGARRGVTRLIRTVKSDTSLMARVSATGVRDEIVDRYVETEVMYQFSLRIISMQDRGVLPNYEASMGKLFSSELSQRFSQTAMRALGLRGQLMASGEGSYASSYLGMVPSTIRGGTSEVQRGIIATRGLGLPRG